MEMQSVAKCSRAGDMDSLDGSDFDWKAVSENWHPITKMWPHKDHTGRRCIAVKFVVPAGASPGSSQGIKIHAAERLCSVAVDWPNQFHSEDGVWKCDGPVEALNDNARRMLDAEEDHMKQLKVFAETTLKAPFEIELPFPVKETRGPPVKMVAIKATGLRWCRFSLESNAEPTCKSSAAVMEEEFEEQSFIDCQLCGEWASTALSSSSSRKLSLSARTLRADTVNTTKADLWEHQFAMQ